MTKAPLRIVQINDIHLHADKEKALLGVKTQLSFAAVIELLKADKNKPDLILLNGDLAQDGSKAAYLRLAEAFQDFPVPVYYVPGNHDDANVMAMVYPRGNLTHHRHIVLKHWHIILLDSHQHQKVEGYLDAAQLQFLQHCLQMYPEHPAIIMFHHQPVPVGCGWLDKIGLTNAEALWSMLAGFSHVRAILFGHVHQEYQGQKNGIAYYSAPSTCIQFKSNSNAFALANLPPGYRWLDLHPTGQLTTGITRAAHYVGEFLADATGY